MQNDELIDNLNNLKSKSIKIKRIENHKDYLFIVLDNDLKILTNSKEIYDVSDYDNFVDIFSMNDRLCAVLLKSYTHYLIDLKTNEVLFEGENVYSISKQDERTLHVIKNIGNGNITLYDIETKKYLPTPDDYEFETSLGDGMYVFCEKDENFEKDFSNRERCIINVNGKVLFTYILGWINFNDNRFIVIKENTITIFGIDGDNLYVIKTITPNETIIAKPKYYKGNIIIIKKNTIKIYNTELEIVKTIEIDNLNEVIDLELIGDTLKFCLPHSVNGQKINKHVFVNLITDKVISHIRIEAYPYWSPITFVGLDNTNKEFLKYGNSDDLTNFNFYDHNLNLIAKVQANSCQNAEDGKECMFFLRTKKGDKTKNQLINGENGIIKEVNYDFAIYHHFIPYGYAGCLTKETIDFFNENLEIVIPNFDYKKYNLSLDWNAFDYFIVNKYICIKSHYIDGYGQSKFRTVIENNNGEVILDSIKHKCFPLGNYIQIFSNGQSQFLNTITGEIGNLILTAPTENNKINLEKLNSINDIFKMDINNNLMLQHVDESKQNIKKLIHL